MKKTVSLLILFISLNLFSQTDNFDFQKVVINFNNGKYKSALEGIEKLITENNDNVEFYLFKLNYVKHG